MSESIAIDRLRTFAPKRFADEGMLPDPDPNAHVVRGNTTRLDPHPRMSPLLVAYYALIAVLLTMVAVGAASLAYSHFLVRTP